MSDEDIMAKVDYDVPYYDPSLTDAPTDHHEDEVHESQEIIMLNLMNKKKKKDI